VITLAQSKGWGYWQTYDYLAQVARQHGTRAVFFELALQAAINRLKSKPKP
jgi:hypothetical protein